MCGKPGCTDCPPASDMYNDDKSRLTGGLGGSMFPTRVKGGVTPLGPRNAFLAGYTDEDTGPDTVGIVAKTLNEDQLSLFVQSKTLRYQRLMADKIFDASHPVDEYWPVGAPGPVAAGAYTFQSDYDMPERIETIAWNVPVGCTSMLLQLGTRTLTLYSGAATTVAQTGYMILGAIINSDDPRVVTLAGTLTSQPYVGLAGFALTRGQFS